MQRNKTSTAFNVVQQRLLLGIANLDSIGIDEQNVELIESFALERGIRIIAVHDFNSQFSERLLDRSEKRCRLMVSCVPQHEDFDTIFGRGSDLSQGWTTQKTCNDE